MMKLLLFSTLFVGWTSYYLCQRTLPSAAGSLLAAPKREQGNGGDGVGQATAQSFSAAYIGQLQSLFAVSYSTSFLICGIMSDAVNMRLLLPMCLAASGLLLAAFPWTEGDHMVGSVVYCLLGLVQGCGWPSTAKILRQMYRPSELGVPWGIMSTGSSLAAFFSPFLVSTVITSSGSWKYSFYLVGAISLSLSLPIALITTGHSKAPSVDGPKQGAGKNQSSNLRWFHAFMVGDLWCVIAIHSLLWLVKASVQDWGELYLVQEGGMDPVGASKAVGLMQFGGVLGKITLGYISNWAMKSKGLGHIATSGKTNRTLVLLLNLILLLVMLLLFANSDVSEENILTLYFMILGIGVFSEGSVIIISLTSMDVVPKALSGTGQATSAATSQMIGRSLAGWPFSIMVDWMGWRHGFLTLCGPCVIGIVTGSYLVSAFHAQSTKKNKKP